MLVYVDQPFAGTWLEKEKVRDGFRKFHTEERTMHCITGVKFVCDERDVQQEILRRVEEYAKNDKDFEDYSFDIPAGRYPDSDRYANGYHFEPTITYVKDLKMSKILNLLTGEQFAQFCKEMKLGVGEVLKNG